MRTLKALRHELSSPLVQLEIIEGSRSVQPGFGEKLAESGLWPLTAMGLDVLQINVGRVCNQTCAHCHVDAGPDREEVMSRETMEHCVEALRISSIPSIDITGGAPEMNPNFRWLVSEVTGLERHVSVRSNLTILTTNPRYQTLPDFFAQNRVTVISSLPCYTADNTDKQRGEGVFQKSIEAIRMLNAVGYGREGSGLALHLVYNPLGPSLPPPQAQLREDYKRVLWDSFGVVFNDLYCITNMPINRFLNYLISHGRYEEYMAKLIGAFNAAAAAGVMCRRTLSVGWDGTLFDCDFNQMLGLGTDQSAPQHIRDFRYRRLVNRRIAVNEHCFGCTAGAGSSCGGEIV